RIGICIAFDKIRLGRRIAEQSAAAPFAKQEGINRPDYPFPQRGVVRLEHHPLRALLDRFSQVIKVAASAEVLEVAIGVSADSASTPDADGAVEGANEIDARGIEKVLLCRWHHEL